MTMMNQWHTCKQEAGDAIVLFRLGDFYEAFHEDALIVSKEAGVTLTKRQDVPMSGVPAHTSDIYVDKLVKRGYKVAIVEQVEEAKNTKGLVKREIVRIVTPGTVMQGSLLSSKEPSFIACVLQLDTYQLAFLDLTTGDFILLECTHPEEVTSTLSKFSPKELLIPSDLICQKPWMENLVLTKKDADFFEHDKMVHAMQQQFPLTESLPHGLMLVGGALLHYVHNSLKLPISHITSFQRHHLPAFMTLGRTTQKHLELIEPMHEGSRTLLDVLDRTKTPMGGRRLRHLILHPLLCQEEIKKRQRIISSFVQDEETMLRCAQLLEPICDIERLVVRAEAGSISPRELVSLATSLAPIPLIKKLVPHLQEEDVSDIVHVLQTALVDTPPLKLHEGPVFRTGYNQHLDTLYSTLQDSHSWLAAYQEQLRSELDIKTLKVSFTHAFGHYIEVSRAQAHKMPSAFEKRQTLVNAERFLSPELKEYAYQILHAEERIEALEKELFQELRIQVTNASKKIRLIAKAIGMLDALLSLAEVAKEKEYVCPKIDDSMIFSLEGARHPVLETLLPPHEFISNDLYLDGVDAKMLIITGPNMGGKSTYMRQAALIAIMAHMGSFIPARSGHIGIIESLFTRIGASDDLTKGHSTFMVEMAEAAHIVHSASPRSLIILDEIGRGTSTYDGIAIARSIAEHLLMTVGAKTLFATHYTELTQLENDLQGALNYHVVVHEDAENIIFLHKIVRGSGNRSYGIHVAKLAGLPSAVTQRAEDLLISLTAYGS